MAAKTDFSGYRRRKHSMSHCPDTASALLASCCHGERGNCVAKRVVGRKATTGKMKMQYRLVAECGSEGGRSALTGTYGSLGCSMGSHAVTDLPSNQATTVTSSGSRDAERSFFPVKPTSANHWQIVTSCGTIRRSQDCYRAPYLIALSSCTAPSMSLSLASSWTAASCFSPPTGGVDPGARYSRSPGFPLGGDSG